MYTAADLPQQRCVSMAKILRAIKPNAGIRAKYRRRLEAMIDDMNRSVVWWLRAEYRREENRIAQDASPAAALGKRIQTLFRYWMRRWQNKLEDFARDFVHSTERKTRNSIKQALKDAGFTVRMDPARAENDVMAALIRENVALIKSIPEHYFTEVTGLVMRSASRGRDVKFLEDELAKRYAITKRRAKLIVRDQSNKATQAIRSIEAKELGITEGVWVHVPGAKSSRKTHMQMNGKRFRLDEGLYDSAVGRKVLPGELVACNCTFRAVIPEFGD